MDVHVGFVGVSQQQFQEAHQRDLDLEKADRTEQRSGQLSRDP